MADLSLEPESSRAVYEARQQAFRTQAQVFARRSGHVSNARLAVFLLALLGWIGTAIESAYRGPLGLVAVIATAGFVALVFYHRRVLAEAVRYQELAQLNTHALARLDRRWSELPLIQADQEFTRVAFAQDLDLFGPRSLFHLLAQPATPLGCEHLAGWLVQSADQPVIARRQQSVAELAPLLELRQESGLIGGRIKRHQSRAEPFLAWAESPGWLDQRPWLRHASRILPVLLLASLAIQYLANIPLSLWLLVLIVNMTISFRYCGQIHEVFGRVSSRAGQISDYVELFEIVARTEFSSEELVRIRKVTGGQRGSAVVELSRLGRLMDLADLRFSQMVYGAVQLFTLWDFHVLAAAEAWQRRSGEAAREWFSALADFEALAALAALRYDNPDWAFAEVREDLSHPTLTADALAHPLLPRKSRVSNDVTVGPPETFLLVTGSNMSGKSTLLRSIGVNLVLAQAGAPACATRFQTPLVKLGTSIRVQDSLGDGVSLFLAELRRLKEIVDLAVSTEADGKRVFLFLLDEILHGTNTVERQIAVRRVMSHLLAHHAIGAISTHDLSLSETEPLASASRPVHFRESFSDGSGGRQMTFDYQLRSGIATTTNALKLLEMVGLNLDGEPRPKANDRSVAPTNAFGDVN